MGDEAGAKKPQLTGPLSRLSEDNITDILARLPAKSVLRCGAVCKAWRGITTDPGFLAAHARLRPTDVVMYTYEYWSPSSPTPSPSLLYWDDDDHFVDVELHAVPVSSDEAGRRHLIRYPDTQAWLLLASSDGVLLFKKDEGFYLLCNPTTRQWAQLPRLPRAQQDSRNHTDREFAFYLDIPSGEFRLLCRRSLTTNGTWCILSTGGAAEPRQVDMAAAESSGITQLVPSLHTKETHVAFRGRLHWPPHQACTVTGRTEMVVFDMSLERFHLMAGPSTTTGKFTKLFIGMDELLGAADFGKAASHVDLWFLGDYDDNKSWELRHRVATPWAGSPGGDGRPLLPVDLMSVAAAGDGEGNVMLGNHKGLVVYNVRRKKTVRTVDTVAKPDALMTRHVFKESLVQQPGFVAAEQSSLDLSLVRF
ncbi:hypothetical protein SETIT_2G423800v2 [Setaria italica]|uniref:F-box domain-containing protein n=1 Tax=Setaria italica TaxID=4555 RepID=K3ZZP2_SETIT|nr:F-box protein At5g49610-like [Setaria italica]RCV14410.1 hypothetical protein SETIT_2G423800v2 [Setaria italica]